MANPVHSAIVRKGVDAIRAWRRANPGGRLDLARADLSKSDLAGADLGGADFTGTNFTGANLSGANLCGSDLTRANLESANLSGSGLLYTVFRSTLLDKCEFSDATMENTVIADCNISSALGLESINHQGPSSIGLDTIVVSEGEIPESFLRGAGVPDNIITYTRSLVVEPIQYRTCFISYAEADKSFADRLYADLRVKGVRCWYFPETAVWGRKTWEDIDRAVRINDKLIVICSQSSLNSPAVLDEIERALAKEHSIARENALRLRESDERGEITTNLKDPDILFPIRLDDYVFHGWEHYRKVEVTHRTIGDFVDWEGDFPKYEASLQHLLHGLDPKAGLLGVSWEATCDDAAYGF